MRKTSKRIKKRKTIISREIKRETKLAREQLSVIYRFLTSFEMRDKQISEIETLLLSDAPNDMPQY